MMQEAGSQPPANFSRGGEVQYFAPQNYNRVVGLPDEVIGPREGLSPYVQQMVVNRLNRDAQAGGRPLPVPAAAAQPAVPGMIAGVPALKDVFAEKKDVYRTILGDPEEAKQQRDASILFEIAKLGLQWAGTGGGSPAENLARAAAEAKTFENITALTGQQRAAERQLDLAAIQAAETERAAALKAEEERRIAAAKPQKPDYQTLVSPDGLSLGVFNVSTDQGRADFEKAQAANPGSFPGSPEIVSEADFFNKYGMTRAEFNKLPPETQSLLRGISQQDKIEQVGDQLVLVKNNKATVIFTATPKTEYRAVNGQLVEIGADGKVKVVTPTDLKIDPDYKVLNDADNGTKTIIDLNTTEGQAAVARINQYNVDNQSSRFTLGNIATDAVVTPTAYRLPNGKVYLSYNKGRSYVDENGVTKEIPSTATPLSPENAASYAEKARMQAVAGDALDEIDQQLGLYKAGVSPMRGGTAEKPTMLSENDLNLVRDAMYSARTATGPYARIGTFVNAVVGGLTPFEVFEKIPENANYLRGVRILGRSALVVNNKFPVAEMEQVGTLFPDPDRFWTSPETEAKKLVTLKNLALSQKRSNLQRIQSPMATAESIDQAIMNNTEIDRLLSLLEDVPVSATPKSGSSVDAFRNSLRQKQP